MIKTRILFSGLPDAISTGLLAGLSWTLWAVLANLDAGYHSAIKAGIVQFTASFLIGCVLTTICAYFLKKKSLRYYRVLLAIIVPVSIQVVLQYGFHATMHTPHVFRTIAPVVFVALVWVIFYSARMLKKEHESTLSI